MTRTDGEQDEAGTSRRDFLKGMAATVGGVALTGGAGRVLGSLTPASAHEAAARAAHGLLPAAPAISTSAGAPDWVSQIGLEMFTVRELTAKSTKDYLDTLEKIARIGYKEIEPAGGYANLTPKQFRAELDRLGLRMPSTHSGISAGPDDEVEKTLAGFQEMGIEYTSLDDAPRPAGQRRQRPPMPRSPAEQKKMMEQFIARMAAPRTVDDVKQEAARYNQYGKLAKKYGIKILRHNHTVEFVPCQGTGELPYTILLAETDPELVVFQMDIGWTKVAGQDPIALFHQHPGRFGLWHVKDAACLKCLPESMGARMAEARLVPVGTGDIDYGEIFKYADVAGMKHFCIEQDSAADWGDAIAATRVSFDHLRATLTSRA